MAISYIGSATGTNSIASMPAHQAGDLLLFYAFRDGSATAPSLPSGYTDKLTKSESGFNVSCRVGYKIAASDSETSGTWTSATSLICQVYRGVDQTTPLGGSSSYNTTDAGYDNVIEYRTITMSNTSGSSWVAGFAGHEETNTSLETAPTGMVNRTNVVDATDEAAGHDTNGGVTSWSTQTVSAGGTIGGWCSAVVEILAGVTEITLTAGNSNQLNTSSAAAITQEHVLTTGNSAQVNTSSAAAITQIHATTSGDAAQLNTAASGAISQEHALTTGNSDQVNAASSGEISTILTLVSGDSAQVNESTEESISQEHILTAGNSDQVNLTDDAAITQEQILVAGDCDQVNTISEDAIQQGNTLTAGNADQINTVTSGSVGVAILAASNIAQINTITPMGEIRLEQIMNLQLLYKNDFDDATAAATSSASGFPLTNAGANSKASVWRSTSLSSQTISGNWAGTAKTINCVALAFTNLIEGSTVQVKLYQEIADVSPYYDSGVRTVWFSYDPPEGFTTIGLIAFPFGGGVHFPVFFNAATVKKFEIIVTSSGNPDGYIEVGRVLIGNAWSPEHNAEYGATIGHVDDSEINRTAGGQYVDRRGMHKTISFDLRYLSDSDRSELSSIVRRNGKRSPVFLSMYPDETDEIFQNGNLFGYFRDPAQFEHVMHSAHDTKVDIDEI